MKCPNCGGTGKEYWNGNVFCNTGFECELCHGTGEVEQTNEELFNKLSTWGKAKAIADLLTTKEDSNEEWERIYLSIGEWLQQKFVDGSE